MATSVVTANDPTFTYPETLSAVNPSQEARLRRVVDYLKDHFREHPTLAKLAEVGGLSPFHFHRLFRAYYGKTLKRMTTELQVEHARQLMIDGVPAAEAADRAGFANQSHLTSRFKMIHGITPGAWLRQYRARKASAPSQPPTSSSDRPVA